MMMTLKAPSSRPILFSTHLSAESCSGPLLLLASNAQSTQIESTSISITCTTGTSKKIVEAEALEETTCGALLLLLAAGLEGCLSVGEELGGVVVGVILCLAGFSFSFSLALALSFSFSFAGVASVVCSCGAIGC
jgi:hypothetical protein